MFGREVSRENSSNMYLCLVGQNLREKKLKGKNLMKKIKVVCV